MFYLILLLSSIAHDLEVVQCVRKSTKRTKLNKLVMCWEYSVRDSNIYLGKTFSPLVTGSQFVR